MIACFDDELVLSFVEGQLAAARRDELDEHLDSCDACRTLVGAFARAHDAPLPRGATLGRYVIGDVLGAGASGRVYGAWDPELDRRVAVKVVRDTRERALREAQAMARLDHPNVVGVHEVGTAEQGEVVFVAMDLVDGVALRVWAKGRPWRDVARAIVDVARGLAAVHAAGLVHRDVKPDNIIVDAHGRARLGDFGLARTPGGDNAIVGTPVYMAPEVAAGEPATAASDQLSLGVTAYEVLAGHRRTQTPLDRAWLDAIIRRAFAPAPKSRWPSCEAFADALAAGLARRRPTAIVAGVAAAAVLASAATYLLAHDTSKPQPLAAAPTCALAADPIADLRVDARVASAIAPWTAQYATARTTGCGNPIAYACLADRGAEIRALATRAEPDPLKLAALGDALAALPPADCLAMRADTADPMPLDPTRTDNARAALAHLPDLRAAIALGDARTVSADVATALDHARASSHQPTLAAALVVAAEQARAASDLALATDRARDAFAAALRGHAGELAAEAAVARVAIAGDRRQLDEAAALADVAAAAIDAAHAPPRLALQLARQRALVAYNRGDFAAAREILASLKTSSDLERSAIESALGTVERAAGDLDAAKRHHAAALAIDRTLHGTTPHPDLARDLHNLAGVARLRGDLDEASNLYTSALAIEVALRGATSVEAGLTHNSLGLVALARQDYVAAQREFALAATALEQAHHGDLAFAIHNEGLVAAARGDHRAALAFYARAAALYASTIGDAAPAPTRLRDDRARSERALQTHTPTPAAPIEPAIVERPAIPPTPPLPPTTLPPPRRDVGVYGSSQTW